MDFRGACQHRKGAFPHRSGSSGALFLLRQGYGEEEHAPRAFFRADHAAVPFHDMLADGKAETCGGRGYPFLFHPVEALENPFAVGFRDTRPLIGHGEHGHGFKGGRFARDGDDAAPRRVTAGIFQKIAEHLGDVVGIGPDVHASVDVDVGGEFLGFHVAGTGIQRVFQHEGGPHAGGLEGHGAAFQPACPRYGGGAGRVWFRQSR